MIEKLLTFSAPPTAPGNLPGETEHTVSHPHLRAPRLIKQLSKHVIGLFEEPLDGSHTGGTSKPPKPSQYEATSSKAAVYD